MNFLVQIAQANSECAVGRAYPGSFLNANLHTV